MARVRKPTVGFSTEEDVYTIYLDEEAVDAIPQWAMDSMAERLSRVVSQHFSQHPEEYQAFLKSKQVSAGGGADAVADASRDGEGRYEKKKRRRNS